jgi:hypothetical protein
MKTQARNICDSHSRPLLAHEGELRGHPGIAAVIAGGLDPANILPPMWLLY